MILVAGGTGRLGARLVPRLVARGERVRVLARRTPDPAAAVAGVEYVAGDVRDRDAVARAMTDVRAVVSAMHGFGVDPSVDPASVDGDGNRNLVAAAERAGAREIVLLSVRDAGADHPLELFRMKAAAEDLVRQSSLAWTILRPGAFLELWLWFLCARLPDKAVIFGRGDNPINFISVDDVACMVERALADPSLRGQALDLGGPDNVSYRELVQTFCRVTGAPRSVRAVPRTVLRLMRHPMRLVKPVIARHMHAALVMDTGDMTFDAQPLKRRFPELPFVSVADAVARDHHA